LNRIYKSEPSLYQNDHNGNGFEWINCNDSDNSIFSFIRKAKKFEEQTIFVVNFTPVPRYDYTLGVYFNTPYKEIFNSDSNIYSGSNIGNGGIIYPKDYKSFGKPFSISVTVPPLAGIILKPQF